MKKILIILCFLLVKQQSKAQYYYKDLLTTLQANQQFEQYRKAGVKSVSLHSFNGNSAETAGFSGEQKIDLQERTITTTTHTTVVGDSYLESRFNEKGWLVRTIDSAQHASNITTFSYDEKGRLLEIATRNNSDNISTEEQHRWSYDSLGRPVSMTRIRNHTDTTLVRFFTEEKGNIGEEKIVKSKLPLPSVFYYYDQQNRLTDIVRYNQKASRLLPDYLFEYNDNGQLKKSVIIPEGSNEYQNWYYTYDSRGLKQMELCYDKAQKLLGKVEYHYTY